MAINPHHTIEVINGKRCSVVEKKVNAERSEYLKKILECSGLEVMISTDETGNTTIGVTNIIFNAMHALYSRSLRTPDGKIVTPACWFQKLPLGEYYWEFSA